MISEIYPYPAYKPSGVPCLSNVPEHWEVVQLGRVGVFSKGSGGTKDDEVPDGIPCVRYGDLYTTHKSFISQTRSCVSPAKASAYTPINRGDVLFPTPGETIEEIGKSAVNLMHTQVLCGGDLIVFRPTMPMEPKFAGYALDCPAAQTQKSLMGRGITIMHIYNGQLKYLWFPLPPLPEQATIVRYLDHADRHIRRYVAAKRKLIALLEEEKQAVINQAVTRGLDPSVRLKPSGVKWLGDVPEHWEVTRVKTEFFSLNHRRVPLSAVERGAMTMRQYDYYGASGVIDKVEAYLFDDKLLLIAEDGANLVLRNLPLAIIASGKFWVNNHAHILKPRRGNLDYLAVVMEGLDYTPWISGAAHPKLTLDRLMGISIAVPPRLEQDEIIARANAQTSGLTAAIVRARRQVELVQEYRTRLIADVVTGKLDVREAAAQLPDEDGDQDPIEESDPLADGLPGDLYDIGESMEDSAMEKEVTA